MAGVVRVGCPACPSGSPEPAGHGSGRPVCQADVAYRLLQADCCMPAADGPPSTARLDAAPPFGGAVRLTPMQLLPACTPFPPICGKYCQEVQGSGRTGGQWRPMCHQWEQVFLEGEQGSHCVIQCSNLVPIGFQCSGAAQQPQARLHFNLCLSLRLFSAL